MKKYIRVMLALMSVAAFLLCAGAFAEEMEVGSYVTFGTYPQMAEGNDEMPIEWLVLDHDGDKALLLSRYGLDAQPYNTEYTDVTWERCTLRAWLNDDFLNHAFTAEEQDAILLTDVDNSDSQGYGEWTAVGGNDTQDKVFLLSYAEANSYLGVTCGDNNNIQSRVAPTAYATAQGAITSSSDKTADGEATGFWWLRSPGNYGQNRASIIYNSGALNGDYVEHDRICVRPALWVKFES